MSQKTIYDRNKTFLWMGLGFLLALVAALGVMPALSIPLVEYQPEKAALLHARQFLEEVQMAGNQGVSVRRLASQDRAFSTCLLELQKRLQSNASYSYQILEPAFDTHKVPVFSQFTIQMEIAEEAYRIRFDQRKAVGCEAVSK